MLQVTGLVELKTPLMFFVCFYFKAETGDAVAGDMGLESMCES